MLRPAYTTGAVIASDQAEAARQTIPGERDGPQKRTHRRGKAPQRRLIGATIIGGAAKCMLNNRQPLLTDSCSTTPGSTGIVPNPSFAHHGARLVQLHRLVARHHQLFWRLLGGVSVTNDIRVDQDIVDGSHRDDACDSSHERGHPAVTLLAVAGAKGPTPLRQEGECTNGDLGIVNTAVLFSVLCLALLSYDNSVIYSVINSVNGISR